MSRLVLSPEAGADLQEIVKFIAQDNPSAAHRLAVKLRQEMGRLAEKGKGSNPIHGSEAGVGFQVPLNTHVLLCDPGKQLVDHSP